MLIILRHVNFRETKYTRDVNCNNLITAAWAVSLKPLDNTYNL